MLSGLLSCAIWRGDTDTQSDLLKSLSECESLDFDQRVRYRAMAALVDPQTPDLSVPVVSLEAELSEVEELEMALMADARVASLPPDLLAGMRQSDDDVPPKSGFQILDRDKPESLEQLPPVDQVPEAIALLFIYGKQTDRDARVEVVDVRQDNVGAVRDKLADVAKDLVFKESPGDPMPLLVACQPAVAMLRFQAKPADAQKLQAELTRARMAETIASLELPLLGGRSLRQVADDESMTFLRTVVVRIIEQFDAIVSKDESIVEQVCGIAKVQPRPPIRPETGQIEALDNEDLNRVDVSGLDGEALMYLLQRAHQVSATPAVRRAATRMLEAELPAEHEPTKMLAYMTLINAAEGHDQALELLERAKVFADEKGLSSSNLLLSEVSLRLQAGDSAGFQKAIETISSRHGNEPEVMAQLQQMLVAFGLISPDGSVRPASGPPQTVAPDAPSSSELWTPDSGAPAAPAQQPGGGKLWVPGMD